MSERIVSGPPVAHGQGEDPLAFYGNVFIRFLQLIFAHFEKGNYRWSADPLNSDLLITDQVPLQLEAVQKVPHLVVIRGPAGDAGLALNLFQGADAVSGRRDYTDLVTATMTITALSREGLEAQRLIAICRRFIRAFRRDLYRGGRIFWIGPLSAGAEGEPGAILAGGAGAGVTAVSLTVPFAFQDFWSVEPADKLLLTGIDLRVTSQAVSGLKPPAMNGEPLQVEKVFSLNSRIRVTRQTTPKSRK